MGLDEKLTPINKYAKIITDYLIEQCKNDETLANAIVSKEQNSVKGMMEYIIKAASKEQKINNCVVMDDKSVFKLAIDYWLDYEDKKQAEKPTMVNPPTTKPKEEKKSETKKASPIKEEAIDKLYDGLDLFSI